MKRTRSKKTGTARMTELGYKPLQLWLSPSVHTALAELAAANQTTMTRTTLAVLQHHLAAQTAHPLNART